MDAHTLITLVIILVAVGVAEGRYGKRSIGFKFIVGFAVGVPLIVLSFVARNILLA